MAKIKHRKEAREKLEALLDNARKTENNRGEYLKNFFNQNAQKYGITVPHLKDNALYIKYFVGFFYQEDKTLMTQFDLSLNAQKNKIFDTLLQEQDTFQLAKDFGLQKLEIDFHKNLRNKDIQFARGNLSEAIRYVGTKKALEHIPGVKVVNSSEQSFANSIQYDILIDLPEIPHDEVTPAKTQIPLEVKTSLLNFHLGTVSANAIGSNKDLAYESFMKEIQSIYNDYTSGLASGQSVITQIKKAKENLLFDLSIAFICWKLQQQFPVFVTHERHTEVNRKRWYQLQLSKTISTCLLCSEVIEGILSGKMNADDKTDIGRQLYEFIAGYEEAYTFFTPSDKPYRYEEQTMKAPPLFNKQGEPIQSTINKRAINQDVLLDTIKRPKYWSSDFKISLWYGKPQ